MTNQTETSDATTLGNQTDKVYYTGTHNQCSFRPQEHAEIMGVEWVTPTGREGRACFRVKYADGCEDLCAISDTENYRLVGGRDALAAVFGVPG